MKTILDATEQENQEAKDFLFKLYKENRELWEKANELQDKLGLGGFWKGAFLAHAEIAKALKGVE